MNIEEKEKLKEEVKNVAYNSGTFFNIYEVSLSKVLKIIDKFELDQQKPVVLQFVADWYEEHKDNFYLNLHRLAWELIENLDEDDFVPKKALDSDFKRWYHKTETAIQTLINMHQFGYTVKKEKLYTVEIPNPHVVGNEHTVLMKNGFGKIVMLRVYGDNWKTDKAYQLTEQEIKKGFEWALKWKKEVI